MGRPSPSFSASSASTPTAGHPSPSSSSSPLEGSEKSSPPPPTLTPQKPAMAPPEDPNSPWVQHRRRPSLLSSSVRKAEHTTFDLGMRDGSPRVITYVKTSQGFDWNQDIFLPSSSDITIHNGINSPETVHEIYLTEDDRFLPS